jgi:hypothetical protein
METNTPIDSDESL